MERIEINVKTGEQTLIVLTDEEFAYAKEQKRIWLEEQAKQQAAEAAKQSGIAKLAAIGLTPDEIKHLLGV